jgi:hypothetical protein
VRFERRMISCAELRGQVKPKCKGCAIQDFFISYVVANRPSKVFELASNVG